MFELDETQQLIEDAARAWCQAELAPAVPALESGELLPYDLLRRLGRDLGVSEALAAGAESRLAKLRGRDGESSAPSVAGEAAAAFGGDPMLTSILLKEISRVSPGVGMVLIATMGCAMAIQGQGSADLI